MPRAMMKGTVIGPVVTPPASKATARNSLGMKSARTNTRMYNTSRRLFRENFCFRVFTTERTRKAPTPAATVRMITMSGTAGTWFASTCKSGSAMVIKAPIRNTKGIMGQRERLPMRTTWLPTPSPMGIMAMSAPREKKPMPTISRMAPSRNIISVPTGISGARVKLSASTMAVMGMTEERDSRVFAFKFFRIHTLRFRFGFSR